MKTSHWFGALVALVLVVFFVTFFSNYVGRSTSSDEPSNETSEAEAARLTFLIKVYPYMARTGFLVSHYELEHRHPGHQDYWFYNDNDETVRIGAISKSCKCQGVEVFVLPEGYQARPPLSEPIPVSALPLGVIGRRALGVYAEERDSVADLESVATAVVLNPDDPKAQVDVPGHRAGWVRMKWTGEKPGRQKLTVKLWEHHAASGLEVELERNANFVDPVRVAGNEQTLGNLHQKDLPRTASFYVWSSTRKTFKILKAEPVRLTGLPASADAVVVGEPVALTTDQCLRARALLNLRESQIRCAYRIPVTLQAVAQDGKTSIDIGNFRRRVDVTTDVSDKHVSMAFSGVMQGSMEIQGVDEAGGISFGSFPCDSEPKRTVFVRSDDPNTKLELDKSRVPEHLRAILSDEPANGSTGKIWKLEVKVLPGVNGVFPREDDARYLDSAIYVRTIGPSPQSIRLAVRGDARDR
jgi:hypothetical protein